MWVWPLSQPFITGTTITQYWDLCGCGLRTISFDKSSSFPRFGLCTGWFDRIASGLGTSGVEVCVNVREGYEGRV